MRWYIAQKVNILGKARYESFMDVVCFSQPETSGLPSFNGQNRMADRSVYIGRHHRIFSMVLEIYDIFLLQSDARMAMAIQQ